MATSVCVHVHVCDVLASHHQFGGGSPRVVPLGGSPRVLVFGMRRNDIAKVKEDGQSGKW